VVQSYEDTFRTKGTHKWPEDPTEQRQTWTRRSQIPFILTWISFGIILTLHAALTGIERPRVTHELIDYFYGNYLYVSRFRASTSHLLIAPVCCSLAIWVWAALTLVELVVLSVQLHANLFELATSVLIICLAVLMALQSLGAIVVSILFRFGAWSELRYVCSYSYDVCTRSSLIIAEGVVLAIHWYEAKTYAKSVDG